jgi:hypothetical protein
LNEVQEELRSIVAWISEQTRGMPLPSERRARMALGCLDLALEHQAGICVLAEQLLWGSVYALVRCMFDAFVRGVWLARCASDRDLEAFELAGLRGKPFSDLVDDVERVLGHSRGVLSKVRTSSWAIFSDSANAGAGPARRPGDPPGTGRDYPAGDTDQALRLAAALGLLSATELASLSGHRDVALACKARVVKFSSTSGSRPSKH